MPKYLLYRARSNTLFAAWNYPIVSILASTSTQLFSAVEVVPLIRS
ncbi:MAG: hypothetical protein CLLPBCKN_001553 [Chroococcidiopsis cubana SAG 39.79]|nr:hypothetical protein [Chroococcidiopsis cubana SAG 39.79]